MSQAEFAVNFFVALFALIDPVGNVPLFAAATAGAKSRDRAWISLYISLFVLGFLTLFYFSGLSLLEFFGISLPAFRIAGGILLFLTALDMLFERRTQRRRPQGDPDPLHHDPSVFPLAMPLLAGPGALASMILLAGEAPGIGHVAMITLVMLAVLAIAMALFVIATPLAHALGPTGVMVVTRLLGMLLAALSVQFVIDGLAGSGLIP